MLTVTADVFTALEKAVKETEVYIFFALQGICQLQVLHSKGIWGQIVAGLVLFQLTLRLHMAVFETRNKTF